MVGAVQTLPDSGWVVATARPQAIAYKALADMRRRGLLVAIGAVILALSAYSLVRLRAQGQEQAHDAAEASPDESRQSEAHAAIVPPAHVATLRIA